MARVRAAALRVGGARGAARVCGPAQDRDRLRALQPLVHPDRRRAGGRLLHRAGGALVDAQPPARHPFPLGGHDLSHRDGAGDGTASPRRADAGAAALEGSGGAARRGGRHRDGAGAALRLHALRARAAEGDRPALHLDRGDLPDPLRGRHRGDPHRRAAVCAGAPDRGPDPAAAPHPSRRRRAAPGHQGALPGGRHLPLASAAAGCRRSWR